MEKIPEETINQIREQTDIVDIISRYVELKRAGRNFVGLCPFHNEKTPSFSVAQDKQIFHCFGCGAGGNVFNFIMDIEGFTFLEAVKHLADISDINLEINFENTAQKKIAKHESALLANKMLGELFTHALLNSKQGEDAFNVLQKRGFTKEIIEKFQIGYAFSSDEVIPSFLKERGFDLEEMVLYGLLIKKDSGYGARIYNRIMFPINDAKGNLVGFSGRALGDNLPKYLNSPQTPLFNKSEILYNFYEARADIRKKKTITLFEGFADVISADLSGVTTAVATMGTALSKEHLSLIKKNAQSVMLCFDGDKAGVSATYKAIEQIYAAGLNVRVCLMPEGFDPDSYIKKYGGKYFNQKIIDAAVPALTFKMKYHRAGKNLTLESEKIAYIEIMTKEIALEKNGVIREFYLKELAKEFDISLASLLEQTANFLQKNYHKAAKVHDKNRLAPVKKMQRAYKNSEKQLMYFMLRAPNLALQINEQCAGDVFISSDYKEIFANYIKYLKSSAGAEVSSFIDYLQDSVLQKKVAEINIEDVSYEPSDKEIADYLYQIKLYKLNLQIKDKEFEVSEAERLSDWSLAAKIGAEIIEIKKNLKKK